MTFGVIAKQVSRRHVRVDSNLEQHPEVGRVRELEVQLPIRPVYSAGKSLLTAARRSFSCAGFMRQ
jgi:hypothetical protein